MERPKPPVDNLRVNGIGDFLKSFTETKTCHKKMQKNLSLHMTVMPSYSVHSIQAPAEDFVCPTTGIRSKIVLIFHTMDRIDKSLALLPAMDPGNGFGTGWYNPQEFPMTKSMEKDLIWENDRADLERLRLRNTSTSSNAIK